MTWFMQDKLKIIDLKTAAALSYCGGCFCLPNAMMSALLAV